MKKNFLAIASLLIAAMLLVVSCAPEANVEAKVEDGLVDASFGVAYGKDVTVSMNNAVKINYTYTLKPTWTKLDNGVDIYGEIGDGDPKGIIGPKNISDTFNTINLGRVTPGLWEITVVGKIGGEVVMKGVTRAYFRNASTGTSNNVSANKSATVYVAPVNSVDSGKLSISIQMEDLGNGNDLDVNKIECKLDGKTSVELKRNATPGNENVYTYSATKNDVTSGYHYITFTVPGYDGGVTKSFLMLPGSGTGTTETEKIDVTITGSVIPSKFVDSEASIKVISLGQMNITVVDKNNENKVFSGSQAPVTVTGGNVTVKIDAFDTPKLPYGAEPVSQSVSYQWYRDGKPFGTSTTEPTIAIPEEPGYYNINCIATFSYTLNGVQYNIYGSETQTAIVFVAPPAQSGSNPGTGNSGSTPGTGDGGSAS